MNHVMELKQTFASGAQRWWCPICGREFVLSYPPHYSKTVIFEGDIHSPHTAGTGELVMGQMATESQPDERLAPFARWLNEHHPRA